MKIAFIGQKGIPSRAGGVEIHVEEIAKRLVARGHEVTVYCRDSYCNNKFEVYEGIQLKYIKSINTKHLDAITYAFQATIDVMKSDYDIIHYHALGPSLMAFLPKIFKNKVVCTCHGLDWQREKWGKFAKFSLKLGEKMSVLFSDQLISVSKNIEEYFKDKYKKEAIYIPNGVERKQKRRVNLIQTKFGLESEEYLLFLARLVPEKGAHYLIEAFKGLDTNKKLVIAGGNSHSREYINSLHLQVEEDQIENIIFTGFVEGEILEELFSNAYMYILPSEIEGLPISLLEALAYGQCCVVSNIQENIDVIEEAGVHFKSKSVSDLRKKLNYLIENNDILKSYKDNAEAFVLNKYNWDDITVQTERVYLSLKES